MIGSNLLNFILWMPIIGVIGVLLWPKNNETGLKTWALINTIATFALTLVLYLKFDQTVPGMQQAFMVKVPWIPHFHINYA